MSDCTELKLNPNEKMIGDFDFFTRALEEDEKKYYGIFISHSSKDNEKYLYPLRNAMKDRDLHPLCDRDFLSGGDDFQKKIESMLDCYAAVIIITRDALRSNWVNYEMGILTAKGTPIYLWDPESILNYDDKDAREFLNLHLEDLMPAYNDIQSLLTALEGASPYAEMFCEENSFLDRDSFRKRMNERVDTVIATLESEIFDEYYADFAECKIGMLIPNFGMFYENHSDGKCCMVKRGAPLEDGLCPASGKHCALHPNRVLDEDNKECVLLNHLLYNAKLMKKGDEDRRGVKAEIGSIVFHLPVHRYYGTEFKIIIDVPDNSRYDKITDLLDRIGLNPSCSSGLMGGRIYISIPSRARQGLFRLVHEFTNNFLCPYAARK